MTTTPLRTLLSDRAIVIAPGVYDAMSAWFAARAGFAAVFLGGSAMAYTQLARPDVNLLAITEIADTLMRIRDRIDIPIIVDGDSGYGNAVNVQRTVRTLERAGASAIQLEDQVNYKPTTALSSRPTIPIAEMVGKLKAALDARVDQNLVISARTDAASSLGVDEALDRVEAFITAGADLVFVEGLTCLSDIQRLVATVNNRVPLLYNILEGGTGPVGTAAEAEALGFSVVLFPGAAVQVAATALDNCLRQLRADGSSVSFRNNTFNAKTLNTALGTADFFRNASQY